MTIKQFEKAVWDVEGIRLVVRAPGKTRIGDYDLKKAADAKWSLKEWIDKRLRPRVGEHGVAVVRGDGLTTHRRTTLAKIRETYTSG